MQQPGLKRPRDEATGGFLPPQIRRAPVPAASVPLAAAPLASPMGGTNSWAAYQQTPNPSASSQQIAVQQSVYGAPSSATAKGKKFICAAGGEAWEDPSLAEWNPDDFRIFVGDLGNECTDEILRSAFARWPSLDRVKVIRDKHTGKTKGFGFVSFTNPKDGLAALREMNGRYIGNRPCKLRKSSWNKRAHEVDASLPTPKAIAIISHQQKNAAPVIPGLPVGVGRGAPSAIAKRGKK